MMNRIEIKSPEYLQLKDEQGSIYNGGNQAWYSGFWKKQAGCGPTAGTNLIWYLSKTREKYRIFPPKQKTTQEEYICLMEQLWQYITPTLRGVNTIDIFIQGSVKYGNDQNIKIDVTSLNIPRDPRPDIQTVRTFLTNCLMKDRPVAFLNLSNGQVSQLEGWHWVTIIGYEPNTNQARIYDQGQSFDIDMDLWLRSTTAGGGLVALD